MVSGFSKIKFGFAALLLTMSLCVSLPGHFAASETDPEQTTGTQPVPADQQGVSGTTDTGQPETEAPIKRRKNGKYNKWVSKNGYRFYYNEYGKKARGLTKIKDKKYLFDKRGRQQHGWQKVDNAYYYFYLTPGKKGCMARSTTINGITLKKNGKAKVDSGSQKMYCLLKCSSIVEQITKPGWSKGDKMRAAWRYMQSHYGYWGVIWYNYSNWAVYYAYQFFTKGGGSCEGLGCAWAFLANACGANSCVCVASGSGSGKLEDGHGWAEIDGLFYDPARARYESWKSSFYGLGSLYPNSSWYHRYRV